MKHFPLRRIILSGIFTAVLAWTAQAQQPQPALSCWDFEEACGTPEDAFHVGCIANAQSTNGSPDTKSSYNNILASSGQKYAHMYANQCASEPVSNRYHTEGIILRHTFLAGQPVKITFDARSFGTQAPTETRLILVNGMPNFGGLNPGAGCLNTLDLLPAIPAGSETITVIPGSAVPGNAWKSFSFTFTPSTNFSQLWFRPKAFTANGLAEVYTHLYLDKVCVEDLCQSTSYNVTACHFSGTDQVWVSINGSPVVKSEWVLNRVWDCNGGLTRENIMQSMLLNFLPGGNSFYLPLNTGCYILSATHTSEGCPSQDFLFVINTDEEQVPECSSPCDDWHVTLTTDYCTAIKVIATPDTYFPSGSTFDFELDGAPVQSGFGDTFFAPISGSGGIGAGWHEVCITVNQPTCPPIEKCHEFYIDCFQGPSEDREGAIDEKETSFMFSNPSSGTIWLSRTIESGMLSLYSVQGALVRSFDLENTNQVNVGDLPSGQYVLVLRDQAVSVSKWVLIHN